MLSGLVEDQPVSAMLGIKKYNIIKLGYIKPFLKGKDTQSDLNLCLSCPCFNLGHIHGDWHVVAKVSEGPLCLQFISMDSDNIFHLMFQGTSNGEINQCLHGIEYFLFLPL